jgi:hypothetical protein
MPFGGGIRMGWPISSESERGIILASKAAARGRLVDACASDASRSEDPSGEAALAKLSMEAEGAICRLTDWGVSDV